MSGWTAVEAHCIDGMFSQDGRELLKKRLSKICDSISYTSDKRIAGAMSGYGQYPDVEKVEHLSEYDGVGIVVSEANDTSDTGETKFFNDGECVEQFKDDRYCREAMRTLQDKYGIYPYISYYWKQISCTVDVDTEERYDSDIDGHVSVLDGYEKDVKIMLSEWEIGGDNITAELDEDEARQLVREIKRELGDIKNE